MMDRRRFLTTVATGSIGLATLSSFDDKQKGQKITILHTNDTHSHIDPFPENHKRYANKGGVRKRKQLIDKIRTEENEVLLLDSGDIFQGTPYFNVHGGEIEMKVMTALGYDAATMGNHDFDGGIDGFIKAMPHANFPFLCANYDFSDTELAGKTKAYKVFNKGQLKIGVFGVGIELDGLVPKDLYKDTHYLNPIEKANQTAYLLKQDLGCDLVICLSHLGHFARLNKMSDKALAEESEHIDLIIGAHTHTFMDKPEMHKNKVGKSVLINQVGWAGLVLGRVDFYFDNKGNPEVWAANWMPTAYDVV
jgi:5'-nucleotidase